MKYSRIAYSFAVSSRAAPSTLALRADVSSAMGPTLRRAVRSARCRLVSALILATTSRSAKGLTR